MNENKRWVHFELSPDFEDFNACSPSTKKKRIFTFIHIIIIIYLFTKPLNIYIYLQDRNRESEPHFKGPIQKNTTPQQQTIDNQNFQVGDCLNLIYYIHLSTSKGAIQMYSPLPLPCFVRHLTSHTHL